MKATGVNNYTKSQLKKLTAEGYTAEEISRQIQVEQKAVENWMDFFSPEVAPEVEPVKKKSSKK
jgi:transposase